MTHSSVGVSGLSVYVPRYRVQLSDWCDWTGNAWDKVQAVVGRSFRVPGPRENCYTMAASAVTMAMSLIKNHPQHYRYFSRQRFVYGKRTLGNHNRMLASYTGMDGIKTGTSPRPSFEDGFKCQAVLDAVERSSASGAWETPAPPEG